MLQIKICKQLIQKNMLWMISYDIARIIIWKQDLKIKD